MHDHDTHLLHEEQPRPSSLAAVRKRGRPPKPDALSDAERARRYRARKKTRLAELRAGKQTTGSIASALPPWRQRCAKAMALLRRARTAMLAFCAATWRLLG
jgi:hypothetical protein